MTGSHRGDPDEDTASLLDAPAEWTGRSSDPNDEQFGDVVGLATLDSRAVDAEPSVDTEPAVDADAVTEATGRPVVAAHDVDVVLVGEPYDGAVIGRKGAAGGPAAIREELAGLKTHRFDYGPVATTDDANSSLRIADLGDVSLSGDSAYLPDDTAGVQDRVSTVAAAVHETDAVPVFLGGDNSLTVGNVRPLLERADVQDERAAAQDERAAAQDERAAAQDERVGVVNFDAHLDVREPTDGPTSGTPYRQLIEAGLDRYVVVGARDFETSTAYADYVAAHGGTILTADDLASGVDAGLTSIASATADLDHLYVSVDLDVLDAAVAPGVSAPTPGGLTTRELFSLVRALGTDDRLAGFELVETAPSLDPAAAADSPERNRTVGAAARTVAHFLAGVAERDTR